MFRRLAPLCLLLLVGCDVGATGPAFTPESLSMPDARPGFTSSDTLTVVNDSGVTWSLNDLGVSEADVTTAGVFTAVADGGLPQVVAPGESATITVVFAPTDEVTYNATVTATLSVDDFRVAGGGCSGGCGGDAPEDGSIFLLAAVSGTGDAEAVFEDCTDGDDNDGDGLIDCEDPDCASHPDCVAEICDDGTDNDDDGLIDCDDPDCAADEACGGPSDEVCDDGIDNDGDGRIDCEDNDCFGDPVCISVEGCDPLGDLQCGQGLQGSTVGAENNWSGYCGFPQNPFTGPEEVWVFTAEEDGPVAVTLVGAVDHDLTILDARGEDDLICDPDNCVTFSWSPPTEVEFAEWEATAGATYFVVVDGFQGAAGQYELTLTCDLDLPETDCANNLDDDGDGLVDCEDPDCAFDPACDGGDGTCQPIDVADCPAWQTSSNNAVPGSTNTIEDWCGEGFDGWTGPELAYLFLPAQTGEVTVSLSNLDEDLDLSVLLADFNAPPEQACDPDLCVANDWNPGGQPEQLEFEAFAGTAYIIVVDGWDGAVSDFTLSVECDGGQGFEFDCADGIDNDGDFNVDCADSDCQGDPNCAPGSEICNDGADNDGDGLIDCDDFGDCSAFPGCDSGPGDCCTDNGSPGCDNQLGEDCVCSIDPFCCQVEWDAICADTFENQCGGTCGDPDPEVECADGADNDNDGLIDCADADCFGDPNCVGPGAEFNCSNNLDDDLDGLVDCDDPDCLLDPVCLAPQPEICDNGLDDDGDGDIDCDDVDCAFDLSCDAGDGDCCVDNGSAGCDDEVGEDCVCAADPFCCQVEWDGICADAYENQCGGVCTGVEVCDNGNDDDADGLADCDDPDCALDPSCAPVAETNCDNGLDDDADGLIDCDDTDCLFDPACLPDPVESACGDLIDNDGDGLIDCADPDCAAAPECNVPGTETNCANGLDDDIDGLIDCSDPDCTLDPNCNVPGFEISCTDGVDNDLDGAVDCDDTDCAAFPACANPAETNCVNGIDDDADGFTDCNDSDCAFDPSCATGETDCADGIDNDSDGTTDCDDNDCSADIECVDAGVCNPTEQLECGDSIFSSNFGPGSTNQQDEYCGFNPGGWTGPEISYVFTPDFDGLVDITLTGLSSDLDIQALVDDGGCDPEDCEANGWNPPPQPEQMDWYAFAGTPYFILIDGWQGATSTYTLTVTCTPSTEAVCDDGLDDDGDGQIDCADIDCLGTPTCPEAVCTDGIDNDADGFIDCNDPDCFGTATCIPETSCVNGIDDDGDGDVDCDDSDCAAATACQPEVACDDGLDNDADGLVDCDDTDCDSAAVCAGEANCVNGVDDDLDGLIDCDDPDCAQAQVCTTEGDCGNGVDDDGDGLTDCFDADCAGDPACTTEFDCADGFDNDFDGDEDCFDSDCAGDPVCNVETDCADNFDNDADGLVDCNDTDCLGEPGCPVILFSSIDDDPADFIHFPNGGHGSNTTWELGEPDTASQNGNGPATAFGGLEAWCTGCDAVAGDTGTFDAVLIAQPVVFDLTPYPAGTLTLSFYHWQASAGPAWLVDLASVVASDDGGNSTTTEWGPSTADTGGWDYVEVDLSSYLSGQLTFGFAFDTLFQFGPQSDGWYIDDVQLIWEP